MQPVTTMKRYRQSTTLQTLILTQPTSWRIRLIAVAWKHYSHLSFLNYENAAPVLECAIQTIANTRKLLGLEPQSVDWYIKFLIQKRMDEKVIKIICDCYCYYLEACEEEVEQQREAAMAASSSSSSELDDTGFEDTGYGYNSDASTAEDEAPEMAEWYRKVLADSFSRDRKAPGFVDVDAIMAADAAARAEAYAKQAEQANEAKQADNKSSKKKKKKKKNQQ